MRAEVINELIGVTEAYELPTKLLELLLSEQKNELFQKFLNVEIDLSHDWFTDYFQQEHGDRDKLKQDFTPHAVSHLVSKLSLEASSVADVCAGTGGLTIAKWNMQRDTECFYRMEEFASRAIPILLFNIAIRNMNAEIIHCDALTREIFKIYRLTPSKQFSEIAVVDTITERKFDAVIMNPPYSLKWSGEKELINDERFASYGVAPKSKADYAFLLHGLHLLKDSGTLVAILPHGVLFRGNAEGEIRKVVLQKHHLETIIGLPEKLFLNTAIPTAILVLKKQRADADVLFIDASKEFIKEKAWNRLSDEHIQTIESAYRMRKNIDKYATVATLETIQSNDYNLNIPRYVDMHEPEPVEPISKVFAELKEIERQIRDTEIELFKMFQQMVGTTPEAQKEHEEDVEKFKEYMDERAERYKLYEQMELFT